VVCLLERVLLELSSRPIYITSPRSIFHRCDPAYLQRAWCLFELSTAIPESRNNVAIEIILTDAEEASFFEVMETEGYDAIDRSFATIRSETAQARQPSDLATIRSHILSRPGGFETLDRTVLSHLDRWFRELGAVKSSSRRRSSTRSRPSFDAVSAENTTPRRRSSMWDADAAFMGPRTVSSAQIRAVLGPVDERATVVNGDCTDESQDEGADEGAYMEVAVVSNSFV
jgi:hypothetical protein